MAISLFPHNQEAYASLPALSQTERRDCIIRPTGTDKSFIGFKYCEDHPEPFVIGLTATGIRYLDGQKDTTETFHTSAVSEMTLGDAVKWTSPDGYRLGAWISAQRGSYLRPSGDGDLSSERIQRLEAIGVIFGMERSSKQESATL